MGVSGTVQVIRPDYPVVKPFSIWPGGESRPANRCSQAVGPVLAFILGLGRNRGSQNPKSRMGYLGERLTNPENSDQPAAGQKVIA